MGMYMASWSDVSTGQTNAGTIFHDRAGRRNFAEGKFMPLWNVFRQNDVISSGRNVLAGCQ